MICDQRTFKPHCKQNCRFIFFVTIISSFDSQLFLFCYCRENEMVSNIQNAELITSHKHFCLLSLRRKQCYYLLSKYEYMNLSKKIRLFSNNGFISRYLLHWQKIKICFNCSFLGAFTHWLELHYYISVSILRNYFFASIFTRFINFKVCQCES